MNSRWTIGGGVLDREILGDEFGDVVPDIRLDVRRYLDSPEFSTEHLTIADGHFRRRAALALLLSPGNG